MSSGQSISEEYRPASPIKVPKRKGNDLSVVMDARCGIGTLTQWRAALLNRQQRAQGRGRNWPRAKISRLSLNHGISPRAEASFERLVIPLENGSLLVRGIKTTTNCRKIDKSVIGVVSSHWSDALILIRRIELRRYLFPWNVEQ